MLDRPTIELVKAKCRAFDGDFRTSTGEEAMGLLVQQFPSNTQVSHVLLKVVVLNRLYSVRVFDKDLPRLSEHIAGLGIDRQIAEGSPEAVEAIASCEGLRRYCSFATKYCGWHNQAAYPIVDSYAEETLCSYRDQDSFAVFEYRDLRSYPRSVSVVDEFRYFYGLECVGYKELDKFLWLAGLDLLNALAAGGSA